MLKAFTQYSDHGYKIYCLNEDDTVAEVTVHERHELPDSSIRYFSQYGLKLALAILPERQLMLMVTDVPCDSIDDVNRKTTMSFQFIATDKENARLLAKLAAAISCDMKGFDVFMNKILCKKEGKLTFSNSKFMEWTMAIEKEKIDFPHPFDRVADSHVSLFIYFGGSFSRSIEAYKGVLDKSITTRAVKLKWDNTLYQPEKMSRTEYIRDIIQRIIDKLGLWKNL